MNIIPRRSSSSSSRSLMPRTSIADEMASFQKQMNSVMNNFFSSWDIEPSTFDISFSPSVDLREEENKYLLDADVPGMSEDEIDVDLHDNILTLKGEKKSERETKDKDYLCVERSYGSFRRDIALDAEVDQNNIKAELKNGVLHVELPKKAGAKSTHKKIPIRH